jgi:hypothetical protein
VTCIPKNCCRGPRSDIANSWHIAAMIRWSNSCELAISMISSTYNKRYAVFEPKDEQWWVTLRTEKAESPEKGRKSLKPTLRCLLEAIKWFIQLAHIRRKCQMNKARWLLRVYHFWKRVPWRNAFLTSSWWISYLADAAMLSTVLMVAGLIIGLNISP